MKLLKTIDLFAGIGGIRKAFETEGFQTVYANDFDKYCKLTYDANFEEPKLDCRDIRKVKSSELPEYDLLLAGFPCQPFSIAGKKLGFKDKLRGTLFKEIARIISETEPKAILLENVKNLLSHDNGRTYQMICDVLENELGYKVSKKVINAKNFGIPQNRERIYIVAFRKELVGDNFEFQFPPTNIRRALSEILESNVESKYYVSQKYYEGIKNHKARHKSKGNGFGYNILNTNDIANAIVVGGMGRERNLIIDKPDYNLPSDRNNDFVRKLTIRECARLFGYPNSFEFPVSETQAYKQLGNTVVVPVLEAIATEIKSILDYIQKGEREFLPVNARVPLAI